jgi:cyclopropane fatty-acyl-phospholipid synthase-like methyltransferase
MISMTSLNTARRIMTNHWDDIYKTTPLGEIPWHSESHEPLLESLLDSGMLNPTRTLDMCSGSGINSIFLAERGFEVHGIDISPEAVRIAEKNCRKRGLTCDYQVGDVLSFSPGMTFGLIFDRGCFHHLSRKEKHDYIRKVHSLLDPGGAFFLQCFSDKNPPFWKNLSKKDLRTLFSPLFDIHFIKDTIHQEPDTGTKRFLHSAFMRKGLKPDKLD